MKQSVKAHFAKLRSQGFRRKTYWLKPEVLKVLRSEIRRFSKRKIAISETQLINQAIMSQYGKE